MASETEYYLSCLGEEGVEVAQRVSKAIRFGLDEVQPNQPLNNRERIIEEAVDFLGALKVLVNQGIVKIPDDMDERIALKEAKIYKYLAYAKSIEAVK